MVKKVSSATAIIESYDFLKIMLKLGLWFSSFLMHIQIERQILKLFRHFSLKLSHVFATD